MLLLSHNIKPWYQNKCKRKHNYSVTLRCSTVQKQTNRRTCSLVSRSPVEFTAVSELSCRLCCPVLVEPIWQIAVNFRLRFVGRKLLALDK